MTDGLDTSADVRDAMTQRLRRGLRVVAALAAPVLLVIALTEWLFASSPSLPMNVARLVLALIALGAAFVLRPGARYGYITASAAVMHGASVSYTLVRIASTGGALSTELPLFILALAMLTTLLPLEPRMSLPLYSAFYVLAAVVGHVFSPPDTSREMLLNMHKVFFVALLVSALGSWLHYRALREMFEWRLALREESRRAALALERARIARDLHDHVGARLTGIALRAEREQKKLPPESRDALIWIQDTIRLCLEELRDTIWALSNSGRDARELVATLRRRAEDIADAADLQLTWTMTDDVWNGRLSPGISVAMSAILREALTNTIRHSGAKHVSVTLTRDSERITVEIGDDGKGLGSTPSEGRGLNNMRSRAKEQDGEVRIEPNGDKGVRVIATIPLLSEGPQRA